jgi:hypothetical protein
MQPGIERIVVNKAGGIVKLAEALDKTNWIGWRNIMMATLEMCKAEPGGYAMGTVLRPDPAADPVGAKR